MKLNIVFNFKSAPMNRLLILSLITPLIACNGSKDDTATDDTDATIDETGGSDDTGATDDTGAPDDTGTHTFDGDTYAFTSAFTDGTSVSYSGQIFRQLLIDDMKSHLGGMTDRLVGGSFYPAPGDVEAELNFYFEFDSDAFGDVPHLYSTDGDILQETYNDVSSGKNLVEKLAGNDETGQHRDWSTELVGWSAPGVTTPESLVRDWFATIDAQAASWAAGAEPTGPDGAPVPAVYITPEGQDLAQLLDKFLRGALAFSQGADDYLDDDVDGKGLLSSHLQDGDEPYSALEHAWDEGFGYFGAARSYPDWSDADISDLDGMDVDGDGLIDLKREVNWGHSVNAGKRDGGAVVATDFTAEAWEGFYSGRLLLSETAGAELTADQLAELQGYRDQALGAWEDAVAATVVHYINDTLQDMGGFGGDDYSFEDHAKHWSEMKGFALAMQFNRRSPLSEQGFAELHQLVGQAPVLETADAQASADYAQALRDARALLGAAYGFDTANLGDDDGENGW